MCITRIHIGPLFFSVFLNDMFLFVKNCDLYKYSDDNTLSLDTVINFFEKDSSSLIKQNAVQPRKFQNCNW